MTEQYFTRTLKKKNYELTDHLGNVRSVITDMKVPYTSMGNDYFLPDATKQLDFGNYLHRIAIGSAGLRLQYGLDTSPAAIQSDVQSINASNSSQIQQ